MDDKIETTAWDVLEHWASEADMVADVETGDPALIAVAREDIARVQKQKPLLLAHSGILTWPQDGLAYQQELRNEWT